MHTDTDLAFMRLAIRQAIAAEESGEVPVGAVMVLDQQVIATGFNRTRSDNDASSHAEIVAIRAAGKFLENPRLIDTTLYVTIEPCVMCVGAIVQARIGRLVFGAKEPRTGAVASAFQVMTSEKHNHQTSVTGGVLSDECASIMQSFFQSKR